MKRRGDEMETFRYKDITAPERTDETQTAVLIEHANDVNVPFAQLLDVLRAKGILTGWDVCAVLSEDWEPCEPDMPPPWEPAP